MRQHRRRRHGDDDGFVLLESIVAIALITILMVALTSLFLSSMQNTAHQRASQGAIRIATDVADQARGLSASGALSGRDQSSVNTQFLAAPAFVQPWISLGATQAFDGKATAGAGATACAAGTVGTGCAALPTTAVTRTISPTTYRVNYYQQWCHLGSSGGAPNCADPAVATDTTLRQYLRVVVAITWADSSCPSGGCHYVTSVMLNTAGDPLFRFRTQPPPAPTLTGCAGLTNTAFDTVKLDISGPSGICALSGGVPPITWGVTGLPGGLALTQNGPVSGNPAAGGIIGTASVGGTFTVTITATDAFVRSTSATLTWSVTYPPLVAQNPGAQASTAGQAITPLTLTATGGSRTASFADQASPTLPAGLTLQNNVITGTPTTAGTFGVNLTVTDGPAKQSQQVSFTWVVNGPPVVLPPSNTTTGPGGAITGEALGSAGTPPYTYGLQGAPAWMQIDPATGKLSGTAGSEIAEYPGIVVTLKDSRGATAQSAPFTWNVYNIPTMVPPGDQTTDLGQSVVLALQTTCPSKACTFTSTGLPGWLTLNPSTGVITGTAPSTQSFYPGITVAITDADGFGASSEFNWIVGAPQRTIISPGDQVWTAGVPLGKSTAAGLQITANCTPTGPCTFSLAPTSQPLPPGLSINSTGLITGTPSATGTWPGIVVRATDKVGGTADATAFGWTINAQPTLDPPGNPPAQPNLRTVVGKTVSKKLSATCLSAPCDFTATGLPAGLAIDATGTISGTASAAGNNIVTVTVTDKTGAAAPQTFTWYVLGISVPPPGLSIPKSSGSCKNDSQKTVNLATYVPWYSAVTNLTFTVTGPVTTSVSGSQMTITAPCSSSTTNTMTVTVTDSGGGAPSATATTTFNIAVT